MAEKLRILEKWVIPFLRPGVILGILAYTTYDLNRPFREEIDSTPRRKSWAQLQEETEAWRREEAWRRNASVWQKFTRSVTGFFK